MRVMATILRICNPNSILVIVLEKIEHEWDAKYILLFSVQFADV